LKLIGQIKGDAHRPMVMVSVSANQPKMVRRRIEFMADTGSDITGISKKDMLAMGISYSSLGRPMKNATGIGSEIQRWKVRSAILRFQGDDNKVKTYGPIDIYILKTLDKTPSLLGRDFITKYNLKLVYDFPTNDFYLEK